MAEENRCQQCGAELSANTPGGVCPKCIMKLGLPTGADPGKAPAPDAQHAVPTSAAPPGGFVPPGPEELGEKVEQTDTKTRSGIGKLSLILAIGGVVLPIVVVLVLAIIEWLTSFNPPYILCVLLFVALEIATLATGIIGRHSTCGKAGLTLSAILLILTAIGYPLIMVIGVRTTGP